MYNLYKQRYIIPTENRVINSNTLVAEKLETLRQTLKARPKVSEDGFIEGLSQLVEEIEPEDPEVLLENAHKEAELILENANFSAEEMMHRAESQIELSRQQAHEDGYEQGLLEGNQKAQEELLIAQQKLKQKEEQLEAGYQKELSELEPHLVDAILKVVEQVFHVQFDDKKEILLYLIQNTITKVESSKEFQIRVCEDNYAFLESHKQEILERVGQTISIDIVSDSLMKENQCTIETDSGVFDCGLGVQLENLIKSLRTLSL
ncbi:flagellar biosynthesis protein [Lachnospiraceae bacterium ZAX-1]